MDEITLEQRKMETLRELSKAEMKVNEAKATLLELQKGTADFVADREAKTIEKIKGVWKESGEIVNKISENYEKVHEFYTITASLAAFIEEANEKLTESVQNFNKHSELWEENTEKERKRLEEIRKKVDYDALIVEEGKKTIAKQRLENEKELGRIASKQRQLKAALEEINKKQNGLL